MKKIVAVLLSVLILAGCSNTTSEYTRGQVPIYKAKNGMIQRQMLHIDEVEESFENQGIVLSEVIDEYTLTKRYDIDMEGIIGDIIVYHLPGNIYDGVIKEVALKVIDKTINLADHAIVESIVNLMEDEKVVPWIAKIEGNIDTEMLDVKKAEEKTYVDPVTGIIVSEAVDYGKARRDGYTKEILNLGGSYITFALWGHDEQKDLTFSWNVTPFVDKELVGIADELEGRGMLVTSYTKGPGGSQVQLGTPEYYLAKDGYYYSRNKDKILESIDLAVAYKVMDDPDSQSRYSTQLYGWMDGDENKSINIENMLGIDEIARLMGMNNDEFNEIALGINQKLANARSILNPNLQRDFYEEGSIGEYDYIIYVPSGIDVYHYTVLIE